MEERDYAFLKSPVSNYLNQVPYWPKDRKNLASVFIIQLRNPDYCLILACATKHSEFYLLYDGNWNHAIDFFSKPPKDFPNPKFISFKTHQRESTLLEMARDALKNAIKNLPDYLLTGNDTMSVFANGAQLFQHPGILKASETLYFERFIEEKTEKAASPPTIFPPYSHERKAFLCRFPFIQGAELPADEFRIEIRRELHRDFFSTNVAVKREFMSKDVKLFVFGKGFLIGDSRHQSKALEAMNTFLAYCFFRGVDTVPVSVQDVGSLTIQPNGSVTGWTEIPRNLRSKGLLHRSIEIDTLDHLIADFVQGIAAELALELRLLHLSTFHYIAGEHLQAFTLAWIVVERRISSLWRTTLAAKGYPDSRLYELCNSDRYTMSVMIDMLEFVSVLQKESAETLHSIRKARNKASHEGRIPSGDEVAKVMTLAMNHVRDACIGLDMDAEELLNRIGSLK